MIKITQQHIAEALGVSRETVTKALQNHPRVKGQTKQKVKAMARKLGYIPNFTARNLSSRRTKTIGVVLPKISHSFFSSVFELMYQYANDYDYNLIPMVSFEKRANEVRNLKSLLSMRVDGIIANISQDNWNHGIYMDIRRLGIPVVFFDRVVQGDQFSTITTDDRKVSSEIVSYALSRGYRKPAHLAGYRKINIGRERMNGFLDALKKYNIEPNPDWIIEGGFSEDTRMENVRQLLNSKNRPDLVFCVNDTITKCVYSVVDELRLNIPDDLGVIGFGNLAFGDILRPRLTTVDMPIQEIAQESVRLIIEHIMKGEDYSVRHVKLRLKPIIRESCR